MLDRDGDGVGGGEGIQTKHALEIGHHKLFKKLELRLDGLDAQVLDVSGEPFV